MATLGMRTRARAYALQVLYALDLNNDWDPRRATNAYSSIFELEEEPAAVTFAESLVSTARESLEEIDGLIQGASRNWRVERMSRVDRNILRLAVAELRASTDVPAKVVINEAVELAKRFGTVDSPSFVNGLLDRIAHQVRGAEES